jgi:hypothetical protein
MNRCLRPWPCMGIRCMMRVVRCCIRAKNTVRPSGKLLCDGDESDVVQSTRSCAREILASLHPLHAASSHSIRQNERRVVILRSEASTKMHITCEDQLVTQSALSRSARLADMHRVDPEGCVRIPCDTRTWTTWLTDDPSRMTAENMDLMLSVIRVRYSYTLDPCVLASAATGSMTLNIFT